MTPRPKTGTTNMSSSTHHKPNRPSVFETMNNMTRTKGYFGNLQRAKEDGFMDENYVIDDPMHFSDPPYCLIKPNYSP